jgi:hypothetical protein
MNNFLIKILDLKARFAFFIKEIKINQGWVLPAFVHLASLMGLALVGVNKAGSNAFFVQRKLLNEFIKETALQACMGAASFSDSRDAHGDLTFQRGASRREIIADMPLVDVVTGATLLVSELT